eukprot:jgi/Bigna1/80818/fgenesh1_pg.74_\
MVCGKCKEPVRLRKLLPVCGAAFQIVVFTSLVLAFLQEMPGKRVAKPTFFGDRNSLDSYNREVASEHIRNEARRQSYMEVMAGNIAELQNFGQNVFASSRKVTSAGSKKKRRSSSLYDGEGGFSPENNDGLLEDVFLTAQPSILKNGLLKTYQIDFLNWMTRLYNRGVSGILADEMGLGKTVQAISMVGYLSQYANQTGLHLIVVPKSTIANWEREFRKWLPNVRAVKILGNKTERAEVIQNLSPETFDVLITSYEMLIIEKAFFRHFNWRLFVVDEAHRLKNDQSVLSGVMRELNTNCRLLLTGTPLQNNLHELWALLNFLMPKQFQDSEAFEQYLNLTATTPTGSSSSQSRNESVISSSNSINGSSSGGEASGGNHDLVRRRLHGILRPFMLRRLKSEVARSVPPRTEINVYLRLSPNQRALYRNILIKDFDAVSGGSGKARLMNTMMQLRKACNHPYLFDGQEPGPPFETGEHLVEAAGKLRLLDRLLSKLKSQGSRVLIFSQMARMLDILEDYMIYRGYAYSRIDGSIAGEERQEQIDSFMADGSDKFVFLLSTRAGGLGLNLQKADQVVIYDSDWNPQADIQAIARAHRIGQTKNVTVYRLIQEGTVEEKVVERAFQKLYLDAIVMQRGASNSAARKGGKDKISQGEMVDMVQFGADQIMRTQGGGKRPYVIPSRVPKTLQAHSAPDFQFFSNGKINQLLTRKRAWWEKWQAAIKTKWDMNLKNPKVKEISDLRISVSKDSELDRYQGLTRRENRTLEGLLNAGFRNWTRQDYYNFRTACEARGRHDHESIARDMGKTVEEIKRYSEVFWERGPKMLAHWVTVSRTLEDYLKMYVRPIHELQLDYKDAERWPWSSANDRFILVFSHRCYKNGTDMLKIWDVVFEKIRAIKRFKDDIWMQTQTPASLQLRFSTLIRIIQRSGGRDDGVSSSEKGKGTIPCNNGTTNTTLKVNEEKLGDKKNHKRGKSKKRLKRG